MNYALVGVALLALANVTCSSAAPYSLSFQSSLLVATITENSQNLPAFLSYSTWNHSKLGTFSSFPL